MATVLHLRRPAALSALAPISLRSNWKIPPLKLPHLLVRGWGRQLEVLATALAEDVGAANLPKTRTGVAAETRTIPDAQYTLRIEQSIQPGHRVATDVTFRAQGDDLYLRFDTRARSRIAWLRSGLRLGALLGVAVVGYWLLTHQTGALDSMAAEYARKYWANAQLGMDAILRGQWVDPTTGRVVQGRPWSWVDFLRLDPKLFMTNLGMAPVLIGGVLAFAMRWMPPNALRYPCQLLGWPTPDEFHNAAVGHQGWVHGRLSALLFNRYRLSGADVIHLQDGTTT